MSTPELIFWSACAGTTALVVLLTLADCIYSRTRAFIQAMAYLTGCFLFFSLFSGLFGTAT